MGMFGDLLRATEVLVVQTGVGKAFEEVTGYGVEANVADNGFCGRLNFERKKEIKSSVDIEELLDDIYLKVVSYTEVKEVMEKKGHIVDPLQKLRDQVPKDFWNCAVDLIYELIPKGTTLKVEVKISEDSSPFNVESISNAYEIRYDELRATVTMLDTEAKDVEKGWESVHKFPKEKREHMQKLLKSGNALETGDGEKLELPKTILTNIRKDLKDENSLMSYILPLVYGTKKDQRKKMLMAGKFIIAILKHPEHIIATSKKYFEGADDTEAFKIVEHTEKSLRGPNSFHSLLYNKGMANGLRLLFEAEFFKKQAENVDEATRDFENDLTKTAFNTNNLHIKTKWDDIKTKHEEPRYKMMVEISQLKTMCQSKNEETLYRFSLDKPDIELPFKDEGASFAFVFAVNNTKSDSVSKMVRSVSFMFSDQAKEKDTQTIEDCFKWAEENESSEIRNLTYKQKKGRLHFVCIRSNAAVTRREGGFCKYFREGILHCSAYKINSKGYVSESGELVMLPYSAGNSP